MAERTWIIQRVSASESRIRFYSPRSWALLSAAAMTLFFAGAVEIVRRHFAPSWLLIPVFLLAAIVVCASIGQYFRSSEGVLHFEISRSGLSFGGLAFRAVSSAPYSALKRVFVGDRYSD